MENSAFEVAVSKLQDGDEKSLTIAAKKSIQHVLLDKSTNQQVADTSWTMSFADRLFKRQKSNKTLYLSRYMDLRFASYL